MFKRTLIAALFLVPATGFAADNTTAPESERGSHFKKADAHVLVERKEKGKWGNPMRGKFS